MATSLLREDVLPFIRTSAQPHFAAPSLSNNQLDYLDASGMGSLRRGYEAGRLGTEANYNLAQEASLRAAGDVPAADALAAQTQGLRQRQSIYTPRVSQVEDIHGIGDVPDYVLGQVGQGAASMQDPAAASAAVTALGTGLSFVPHPVAKTAGVGLRNLLAPAVAYALNQRQMTGEQYGRLSEDPSVTARYTPQEINEQANLYGAGAGLLDTAIPGLVGRQLGGAALLAKGAKPLLPSGLRVAGGLVGEGATETAQELGGQVLHGRLNPERDVSGDESALLNAFVGGMAGATGPVAAGHVVDTGLRGLSKVPGAVTDAAGTVVDMAKGAMPEPVQTAAKTAFQKTVDLKDALKRDTFDRTDPLAEIATLRGEPPAGADADPETFRNWMTQNEPVRTAKVSDWLAQRAAEGDEQAAALQQSIAAAQRPNEPLAARGAVDAAAEYMIDVQDLQGLAAKAAGRARIASVGRKVGEVGGKVARGALDAAKSLAGGLAEGAKRKLNAQELGSMSSEDYEGRRYTAMRAFDEAGTAAEPGVRKLMAEYLAKQGESQLARYQRARVDPNAMGMTLREAGREIADIADSWGLHGQKIDKAKRGQQFDNLTHSLNDVAEKLSIALGDTAPATVAQLRQMLPQKEIAPLFDYLDEKVKVARTPQGRAEAAQARADAWNQALQNIPPEVQTKLLQENIDLRNPRVRDRLMGALSSGRVTPEQRAQLTNLLGDRKTVNSLLDTFYRATPESQALEEVYANAGPEASKGLTIGEDGEVYEDTELDEGDPNEGLSTGQLIEHLKAGRGATGFDARMAEKNEGTRPDGKIYAFNGQRKIVTDANNRDPLAVDNSREYKKALREWEAKKLAASQAGVPFDEPHPRTMVKRPRLFLNEGDEAALANRRAALEKQLKLESTPQRMLEMLQAERAEARKKYAANRESAALLQRGQDLNALIKRTEAAIAETDNPRAQQWLDETTKTFFADRQGTWQVEQRNALDVLAEADGVKAQTLRGERNELSSSRDQSLKPKSAAGKADIADARAKGDRGDALADLYGVPPAFINKLLARYRDYLQQEAQRLSNPAKDKPANEAGARALREKAILISEALLDRMDLARTDPKYKLDPKAVRTTAGERAQVVKDAVAYFDQRSLLVAERGTKKDAQVISPEQITAMAEKGKEVHDLARKDDKKDAFSSEVLVFTSPLASARAGEIGKPGPMFLRVKDIAAFGRSARFETTKFDPAEAASKSYSPAAQNKEYLQDFMSGLASLVDSQYIEDMPAGFDKLGPDGKPTIPAWLPLKTQTYGEYRYGIEQRAKKDAASGKTSIVDTRSEKYQAKVGADQARGGSFTPDDAANALGEKQSYKERDRGPAGTRTDYEPIEDTADEARERNLTADAKKLQTRASDATPLDYRDSDNRLEEDFKGTRLRTAVEGRSATTATAEENLRRFTKRNMLERGAEHGQMLGNVLATDFAAGMDEAKRWLRAAQAPVKQDGNKTVGGPQYIAPLVYALNGAEYESFGTTPEERAAVQSMRREVARILAAADLHASTKVTLARELAKVEGRSKITAPNVQAFLNKVAAEQPLDASGPPRTPTTKRQTDRESTELVEDFNAAAKEDAAPVGKLSARPSGAARRKLNAQVSDGLASTKAVMAVLGFKAAPPQFADVASKLLSDPRVRPEQFMRESAQALSHLLMAGKSGEAIREALTNSRWDAERTKLMREGLKQGLSPKAARAEAFRALTERSLRAELQGRSAVEQAGKQFMSAFRAMTSTSTFDDVVRRELNRLVESVKRPLDLQRNFKRVTFQEAIDADPSAAALIAHMSKNPDISLTGSIVLAHNGAVYRDASNMLHDVDFRAAGGFEAAEAHLRKVYDGATQVNEITDSVGSVRTYIVPPPGAQVVNMRRQFGDKGGLIGYEVTRDGQVIGRKWVDSAGEHREGESGVVMDFFPTEHDTAVTTIPFTMNGKQFGIKATAAADIFDTKLSMGRDKDLLDYLRFVPAMGRQFSQQNPSDKVSTQAERDEATAYVEKVLGPQIKTAFKELTGYSGEFIEAQNVIEISTTPGASTLQIAYHEALHAFFAKFLSGNPQALSAFQALADDRKIMERVQALLADHPAALAQLTDGEERLAYIYQFWAAGLLDLPTKKAGILNAIKQFFYRVFGMVTDSERATAILEAFHAGKMTDPSVAGQVIAKALGEGMLTTKALRKVDRVVAKLQDVALPTQMILARSESETARNLAPMFWTNPGDETHGDKGEGYINAKTAAAKQYKNLLDKEVSHLSERDLKEVARLLQEGKATDLASIPYAPHREAVKNIDALLQRFYRYMTEGRGMQIGKINEGYFPRVWDVGTMLEKQAEFIDMLKAKYGHVLADGARSSKLTEDEVAQRIFEKIVSSSLGEHILPQRSDGVLSPFFSSGEMRELKWLKPEDSAPYQSKDLIGTLTNYFHSGARAAEYTFRFGQDGHKLALQLGKIEDELKEAGTKKFKSGEFKTAEEGQEWAKRRMEQVHKAVGAIEGTLGSDIGSAWRNTSAWITVYQNLRLLPLTLFSSVVDPLGMVARGGTMKQAYDSFLRGMREVFANWGDMLRKEPKQRQADEWEKLALAIGTVDAAIFSHHVADEYSSLYMAKKISKVNETFFRLNGMEAWNKGMRVGATQAAVNFLERHAKLPEAHSARWLKELGLTPADLTFTPEGQLVTDKNVLATQKGITKVEAEQEIAKTHQAIRRWVEGAVLTPNAAQRPAWASDPHYSMFFHLKQFSYSFHQTILKRAVNEMNYGNMAPIGAFMWYVPVMIASDVTKGLLQGGGELPAHMKGMDLGDWLVRGVNRSGLLGVGSIGVDAQQDLFSVAGPAVEQVVDAFGQPIGRTIADALPMKPLFAEALR